MINTIFQQLEHLNGIIIDILAWLFLQFMYLLVVCANLNNILKSQVHCAQIITNTVYHMKRLNTVKQTY